MSEKFRWRKIKKNGDDAAEALLREWERYCVGACARFIKRGNSDTNVWKLCGKTGGPAALIVQNRSTLLPVFCGHREIPAPPFLDGFFTAVKVHSIQGIKEDAVILEDILAKRGKAAAQNNDYYLMIIDKMPESQCYKPEPASLVLRVPQLVDLDSLAALQAGYEQEEVLPRGAVFNPAASRINTAQLIVKEGILAAELDGRLVGKININAISFTRFQVGGVYVHPDFRGLGIARCMAAVFIGSLIKQGRGVTLYVRKSNHAARRLYDRLGFTVTGDYRISYY
ncbi:MAG: GNAT family N-acetyltransferase [Treponema sp.]|nr:GNAT family N-acetyltransferase [Treponema sp.]